MNEFFPNEDNRKFFESKLKEHNRVVETKIGKYSLNGVLSDGTIKDFVKLGIIGLETSNVELITQEQIFNHINCSSVDVTLAKDFKRQMKVEGGVIDTQSKEQKIEFEEFTVSKEEGLIVYPGDFILGRTNEIIDLPKFIDAIIIGRSSIARQGLQLEAAGYIDPQFRGTITLEITNFSRFPVKIYPGQRIGQFRFEFLDTIPLIGYAEKKDSKYQGQIGATASKLAHDNLA